MLAVHQCLESQGMPYRVSKTPTLNVLSANPHTGWRHIPTFAGAIGFIVQRGARNERQRFLLCFFDIAGITIDLSSFRALQRSDFPLLQRWLSEPHVDAWWHEALDLGGLERKYGPRIDGADPTHVFIIEHESRPIGWIQWYRWAAYPKHAAQLRAEPNAAGIDLSIGEASLIGKRWANRHSGLHPQRGRCRAGYHRHRDRP